MHGTEDRLISVGASRRYADAARAAGDRIDLEVLLGVGHAAVIDPRGPAWPVVESWIAGLALPAGDRPAARPIRVSGRAEPR